MELEARKLLWLVIQKAYQHLVQDKQWISRMKCRGKKFLSRSQGTVRLPKDLLWGKGDKDTTDLGANTNAKHICAKFFLKFFLVDIFLFDANERICFCFQEFPTFT